MDRARGPAAPIGKTILAMLGALDCRGPDSAGVALYGADSGGSMLLRVKLGDNGLAQDRTRQACDRARAMGELLESSTIAEYLRLKIDLSGEPEALVKSIESIGDDVEVISMGQHLEIVKQVGSPANLEDTYGIGAFTGSHAIGHTRLSTESRIDLSHSQPFWGRGYPDLAIVHNGHITNYHNLRCRYEQEGVRFYTENDSEIIGIYLARQLERGTTLEEALDRSLDDLDGSFSYLVATDDALGFAKDRFAFKPLLYAETHDFAIVATEEIAIRAAVEGDYLVREAQAREVRVWPR